MESIRVDRAKLARHASGGRHDKLASLRCAASRIASSSSLRASATDMYSTRAGCCISQRLDDNCVSRGRAPSTNI